MVTALIVSSLFLADVVLLDRCQALGGSDGRNRCQTHTLLQVRTPLFSQEPPGSLIKHGSCFSAPRRRELTGPAGSAGFWSSGWLTGSRFSQS